MCIINLYRAKRLILKTVLFGYSVWELTLYFDLKNGKSYCSPITFFFPHLFFNTKAKRAVPKRDVKTTSTWTLPYLLIFYLLKNWGNIKKQKLSSWIEETCPVVSLLTWPFSSVFIIPHWEIIPQGCWYNCQWFQFQETPFQVQQKEIHYY